MNIAKKNNMELNHTKCKYMPIKGRKRYNMDEIKINIENNQICKVTNYKYLGIIIDHNLNWKEHIKSLTKKIHKFIPIFYNIRNYTKQKVGIQLYKTMIMNVINYGILIYANSDTKILQKLIDEIIGIIDFTKDKKISNLKSENKIMNIENYNKLEWIKLAHDIIHNSKKLPEYYKNY